MALDIDPTSSGFEAYCSVAEADAIDLLRGTSSEWVALTELQKEVQIRLASEYIDNKHEFIGVVAEDGQNMAWPRSETTFDDDELPEILKRATYVLARDTISTALYTNVVAVATGEVKSTAKKLGSLSTKVEYYSGGSTSEQNEFAASTSILKPLITPARIGR